MTKNSKRITLAAATVFISVMVGIVISGMPYTGDVPVEENYLGNDRTPEEPMESVADIMVSEETDGGSLINEVSSLGTKQEAQKKDGLVTFRSKNLNLNFSFEYPATLSPIEYPIPSDADWNSKEYPGFIAVFFEKNFSINLIKGFNSVEEYLDWEPIHHQDHHFENIVERENILIAGQPGVKEKVYIILRGVKTLNHFGYYVYYKERIYEFVPFDVNILEVVLKSFRFLN